MSSSHVIILTQKLENLPKDIREKFAQYLNEHFEDLKDELLWDEQFNNTEKLSQIVHEVRKEISLDKAKPFPIEKL